MRRNGKEENTGKTQEPLETARKPRRGRKPRAAKQQEEAGAATAAETETVSEKTEETATESETVSEKVEETATESETVSEKAEETVTETETASEKAEETATESETISENVEETVTESETISENVEETVTESETASEKAEETATEPETVSEKVAETVMESETVSEQKNTPGEAEMSAAETESVVQEPDSGEQAVPPSETAQEADTGHENETAEEPAAEGENACEEDAAEEENTEEPGEEPERLPATAIPAQITVSPLKRMKQEFSERAQIIREQMRNIQNAFITIGFQLHWIRENNMFRVMDYKNVYDYAEKEYGLKKTTCCNFISIIENYAERDENGEVIESIADCYRNYSASQLVAMLGMNEDMRQQVSPDMSVRAINRLKKGGPEPGTVADSPAPVEEPAPVKETEKEPDVEKEAENPAAEEEAVSDDTVHEEGQETGEMQEAESPGTAEVSAARLEEPEDTETENHGDDAEGHTLEAANSEGDTLVEIDSYTDYQSMADELDLLMRTVFAEDASVRVKIVCVQG